MDEVKPRLTAIQLCSSPNVEQNLANIEHQLKVLTQCYGPNPCHLVVLPECCLLFGGRDKDQALVAQELDESYLAQALAQLANKYGVFLLAGSVPIVFNNDDKFSASSLLFSPEGQCIAHYEKMHLFDVTVDDNEHSYRESATTSRGTGPKATQLPAFCLGFSICYDLRFPELFRALRSSSAKVIAVPSAFTQVTGEAHWQPLLQARAIENQVYIIAAGQQGTHQNGRQTYGHSMIISPWGEVLAIKETGTGFISAQFDAQLQQRIRRDIPVNAHNQFSVILNDKRN